MIGNNILFDDRKVKKKNKELFKTDNIVVDKILVSKKEPYGTTKSNISLDTMMIDDGIIRALCIKLPQMIGYVKCLNNNDNNNNNIIIIIIIIIIIKQCLSRLLIISY